MKKLVLAVAVLASSVSSFAISDIGGDNAVVVAVNEKFKEISLDKIPSAVISAVKEDFASATISKAYVNTSEQYMLTLSIEGKEKTVYADKEGKWLKADDVAK